MYCTDDFGHIVHLFTLDGKHLPSCTDGRPLDTGAPSIDYYPTNVAVTPSGGIYIADGHGQLHVPHGIDGDAGEGTDGAPEL